MTVPDGATRSHATCPACAAAGATVVGSRPDVTLVRCGACGLVYSDPAPRAQVRKKYVEDYDLAAHFGPLATRKRVLYERRFARLPGPRPGKDRLCDVGCGDGQFLGLARERGWDAHGIELNPPAARRAEQRGARVAVGVLEELDDLAWGTFDLVTSWDVLEHTPDPALFAERLVRLLAPGGTLVVTTLNRASLAWWWFGMRWSMVCDDHFTYWDRRSLSRLFRARGLAIDDVDVFGLGRDFLAALDRRGQRADDGAGAGAAVASAAASVPEASAPATGGWDVNPLVLGVESALNRVLRLVGGGVGIGLTMHRPGDAATR
jgi:SAM-dependent methyltransferase